MDFRVIKAEKITETVKELLTDCNYNIGSDITNALEKAKETEKEAQREPTQAERIAELEEALNMLLSGGEE